MRRRLSTRLYKYGPRLLSRSTTILKPSNRTWSSIVCRIFAGAIAFSVSLFGARFRVEGVSARTGAILIRDRNLLGQCGQRQGATGACSLWRGRAEKAVNRKIHRTARPVSSYRAEFGRGRGDGRGLGV